MKASRMIWFWTLVIGVLILIEVAELTNLFRLPVQSAVGSILSFVFALAFTTILALIGAIFIGIYISQRLQSPTGFTPFEEEMLRMRGELREVQKEVRAIRASLAPSDPPAPPPEAPK